MRYTGTNNQADQARIKRIRDTAADCKHSFKRYHGDALHWEPAADVFGYHVGPDVQFHLEYCTTCETRREVTPEGDEIARHLVLGRPENVYVEAQAEPGVYVPRNDGIDSFNESTDADKRDPLFTNLFDRRGGAGGIGD